MKEESEENKLEFVQPKREKRKNEDLLTSNVVVKKEKKEIGQQILDKLPLSEMYEKSYMHTDVVSHIVAPVNTGFVITMSKNGILKFWKKYIFDIEFVRQYRAHVNEFNGVTVSFDGQMLCTSSDDNTVKVFDVVNFDMVNILKLEFTPGPICLIHQKNHDPRLMIIEKGTNNIHIFNPLSGFEKTIKKHSHPIHLIKYNGNEDVIITMDQTGIVEYWNTSDFKFPKDKVNFKFKSETDLFEFVKEKTFPVSIEINNKGTYFSTMGKDKKVRIFEFKTGKLIAKYDETNEASLEHQKDNKSPYYLEPLDYSRRMAVEKTLDSMDAPPSNVTFDESSTFILYPTYVGIKVINFHTNELVKILGKFENTERFLEIVLFQEKIEMTQNQLVKLEKKKNKNSDFMNIEQPLTYFKAVDYDPTVFTCAFSKKRFFMFTNRDPSESDITSTYDGRDIFNEKPTKEDVKIQPMPKSQLGKRAIIHTDFGDLFIKLHFDECHKTVENFTVHSNNGYYNNILFHRVIKGFMCQTGDPNGDGTGGKSIWGKDFEDEINPKLRFDKAGIVAMANTSKLNTNGSQFFITTTVCNWLNDKHTIFGELTKGFDVLEKIEKVEVDKSDKPKNPIRIINIEIFT